MKNIVNLILSDTKQARTELAAVMQAKAFDLLDNYQVTADTETVDEDTLEEAADTVVKDKDGTVKSWRHEGDWVKKAKELTVKQGMKKAKTDAKFARTSTEKLTKESLDAMDQEEFDQLMEDFDQLDELSKATLGSYIKKSAKDSQMATKFADPDAKYNKTQFSKDAIKTRTKRNDGISQATDRLTK